MSNPTSRWLAATLVVGALLLASCGSDALEGTVVKDGIGCTIAQVDRSDTAPAVDKVKSEPKKIDTTDIKKGTGCGIASAKYVMIDLVGATAIDGKPFVDTYATDRPITVELGANQLITGLESGLKGMKVGGRRSIVVPADQAYGKDGDPGQGIGADLGLSFVVDLVEVSDARVYCNAARSIPAAPGTDKPTSVEMPLKPPTDKTTTKVLTPGTGEKVTKKSFVTVDYLGIDCFAGQQFDTSWDRGEPFTAGLSDAKDNSLNVIPGWTAGLAGQTVGSLVQLEIPSADAYGAQGSGSIAPNDPLVFVIKIISASDQAPAPATTTTVAGDVTTTTAAG